jgi:voltage-gated potassium channel
MEQGETMTHWLIHWFSRRVVRHPPATLRVAVLLTATLAYGATGFLYFELPANPALTWSDSIWYAVVTVSTVGYGDFSPATLGGRFLVAAPLMFFGIGLLGYVLSLAASALIEQKSKEAHGMGQFDLTEHLVICNFPNLGVVEHVLDELAADAAFDRRRGTILIDQDLVELPPELAKRDVCYVRGDPSRDETLARANIDEAKHVIVLSKRPNDASSDLQNLAIVLAIEARNPKVHSVSQCVDPDNEELLRKAQCNRVVCTSRLDAHFVATELLNPGVQDVVHELTSALHGEQLYITPFAGPPCRLSELSLSCQKQGHLLIGLRRAGTVSLNVAPDYQVQTDDEAVTIGTSRLARLAVKTS